MYSHYYYNNQLLYPNKPTLCIVSAFCEAAAHCSDIEIACLEFYLLMLKEIFFEELSVSNFDSTNLYPRI
jgi:hypothetical protein